MKEIGFMELYKIVKSKLNPRKISPLIEAGRDKTFIKSIKILKNIGRMF